MWFNVLEILFICKVICTSAYKSTCSCIRAGVERERESYPPYQIMLYSQRHVFASLFLCLFTGQSFPLMLGVLIFVETTYRRLTGIYTTYIETVK